MNSTACGPQASAPSQTATQTWVTETPASPTNSEQAYLRMLAQDAIDQAGVFGSLATVDEVVRHYQTVTDFVSTVDHWRYTLEEARDAMAAAVQFVANETGRAAYLLCCEEDDIDEPGRWWAGVPGGI